MIYRIFPNLGFRIYKHFHFPCQSPVPHHRYSLALQPRPERPHHFRTPCHGPRAGPAPNATSAFPPRVPRPHRRAERRGSARVAATEPQGPAPAPASPGRRRLPLKHAGKTAARPRPALGRLGGRQRPTRRREGLRRGGAGRGGAGRGSGRRGAAGVRGSSPFPRRRRRRQHFRVGAEAGRRRCGGCYCSAGFRWALSFLAQKVSVCPASSRPLTPGG